MTNKRPFLTARLSSFALDVSLTYFLSFLLSPNVDILSQMGNRLLLSFDLSLMEFSLARLLALLLLTMVLRFYCVLFFGHTLFAPLYGLYPREGFIWSRVGGGLRLILDLLLFPIILFQLVFTRTSRTLSEQLTKTQLIQKDGGSLAWVGHFLTPILILLSLYSPLFMKLSVFDGVKVVEEEIQAGKLEAGENFDQLTLYKSEKFKIETLSHLAEDRFVLMPDYDFRRSSGQLRVSPYVKIIDRQQKRVGQFKIGPDVRWTPLLLRSKEGMPFWSGQFEHLAAELSKLSDEELKGDVPLNFSAQACDDFQRLLKSSFELGGNNLIDHTLEFGPFIRGLVQLRSVMLDIIDPTVAPQVDLIRFGQTPFLRFRQLLEFSELEYTSRHTLFPLCVTRAPYYELNFKNDLASTQSRRDFTDTFLSKARWDFVEMQREPIPQKRAEFHLFHLIDGLLANDIGEQQRLYLEEGSSYFLFNLGHLSFEDDLIYRELLVTLERIEEIVGLMDKKDDSVFTKSFLFYLDQSKEALKNKNANYFAAKIRNEDDVD